MTLVVMNRGMSVKFRSVTFAHACLVKDELSVRKGLEGEVQRLCTRTAPTHLTLEWLSLLHVILTYYASKVGPH